MNKVALQKCSYGVYIISAQKDGKLNGQIANTVIQVTSDPVSILVCINKNNLTHDFIKESKAFSVSILSEEAPMQFIGQFGFKSGRDIDKFQGVNYKMGKTNSPIVLDYTTSYLECELIGSMDVGTHTVFVGNVVDADIVSEASPMTYAYYHQVKGGKSPKSAPTYAGPAVVEEKKAEKEGEKMDTYTCTVCGYVYDPAQGDPDNGVAPGTAFEDIPDSWVCPVCGAPKSEFQKS